MQKAESKKVLVRQNGSDEDPTVEGTPSTDVSCFLFLLLLLLFPLSREFE